MKETTRKPSIYDEITEKIILALEDGVIPWVRPWQAAQYGLIRNAFTNRPYRGMNTMLLTLVTTLKGFVDPRWLTFRNAEKLGGSIKKGEKGVHVIFWKFLPVRGKADDAGTPPDHDDAGDKKQKVIPFARAYTVFNAEQCEGLDLPALTPNETIIESNELADTILALPEIKHGGARACYSPSADRIIMPARQTFENQDFYYSTAFHETVHWTGHPTRLARTFGSRFGDQDYAVEELVAEIGSAFLGSFAAIPFEEMRHPEYINDWLRIMKADSKAIFTAAAKAQTAADFVLDKAGLAASEEENLPEAA